MFEEILQPAIEALVQIIFPVLLGYLGVVVVQYVTKARRLLEQKLSFQDLAIAEAFVKQLVIAAEQSGLTQKVLKTGAEKKAWVLTQSQQYLDKTGIKVDLAQLSTLVEAIVYDEFNRYRNPPIPQGGSVASEE